MSHNKRPLKAETKRIDNWECPWCGELNSIDDLTNGTPDLTMQLLSDCPKCGNEVLIMPSIEFTCSPTKDGEPVEFQN